MSEMVEMDLSWYAWRLRPLDEKEAKHSCTCHSEVQCNFGHEPISLTFVSDLYYMAHTTIRYKPMSLNTMVILFLYDLFASLSSPIITP